LSPFLSSRSLLSPSRLARRSPRLLAHLGPAALVALILLAAGQPLQTDDTWWHLALGRAYATEGPWLAEDPLLHTAAGPPAPAAWLSDLALFFVERAGGIRGLRVTHVLLVTGILALTWSLLRRASGSPAAASLGVGAFGVLTAYRLYQLRPHLVTILATLVLYRLLLEKDAPPSRLRVVSAVGVLALWANAHGGFVLGPILLATAVGGLLLAAPLRAPEQRERDRTRALRLAAALGLGLLATLASPEAGAGYLAYLEAGTDTPELAKVVDEWRRVGLFHLPAPNLPPSPLAWGLVWGLLLVTTVAALQAVRRWRRDSGSGPDPVRIALAGASIVAMLVAVRFLWLGIFPLLLLAQSGRVWLAGRVAPPRAVAWAAAAAALLLAPGFLHFGDWPMLSRGMPRSWPGYARPYPAGKYQAHAIWMLEDAGLEGNLYNDYYAGGFLGFWVAPRLRAFVNGTLNLPKPALAAYFAIRGRDGLDPDESFPELLDRYRVDLFLGIELPKLWRPNRPWSYTTTHLERTPGWIPVFRNLRSAVYLRANPRNRANLERVSGFYARHRVPFDPDAGFDPERVIREAPEWATRHGLVPTHFGALVASSRAPDPVRRRRATSQLASLYAALGLYERAIQLDRGLARSAPGELVPRRRLVWSLLHLGRADEAIGAARALDGAAPSDLLSLGIAAAARRYATLDDPGEAAALVARLPLFTRAEARRLGVGVVPPAARAPRR
jgi:hypothetical protein